TTAGRIILRSATGTGSFANTSSLETAVLALACICLSTRAFHKRSRLSRQTHYSTTLPHIPASNAQIARTKSGETARALSSDGAQCERCLENSVNYGMMGLVMDRASAGAR